MVGRAGKEETGDKGEKVDREETGDKALPPIQFPLLRARG
jgi:hypothetical protein